MMADYKVELFCTKTAQSEHGVLHFPVSDEQRPTSSTTVLAVKKKVEDQFSIPVCVQKLSFEAHLLSDDTLLEGEKIRSEDTLLIEYSAKGDCKEISSTVVWFRNVREVFIAEDPTLTLSVRLDGLISQGFDEGVMHKLTFDYFFPWLDAEKHVNKLYFMHCGGLEVVMDIYAAVHRHPWCECAPKLQLLEDDILRVLWNFCETFDMRRLIISHNNGQGLDLCIKSLLRQKIEEGKDIQGLSFNDRSILVETITGALGLLWNLCELSECHTEIASNADCLDQLTCLFTSNSFTDPLTSRLVATVFLCLAYTPSTHPFITKPLLIRRLLDTLDLDANEFEDMTGYFTLVFLAQVVLISPQCIPNEFQQHIQDLMDDFLKTVTYQAIMEGEVTNNYVWSTLLPYIKLMYAPEVEVKGQLHMLSLQIILLSLQNMLGRDVHRELLFKEGLEEYVTCMPVYVPVPLKEQAKDLVRIVTAGKTNIQLQPPKLVNLASAKLAKLHFGLECVLHKSVREILAAVYS